MVYELAAHDLSAIFYRRSQFETVYRSYGARGQTAEIYCKIIYDKMNQFEARSILTLWKIILLERSQFETVCRSYEQCSGSRDLL